MARKDALSAENLAALGADRLAALLMELAETEPSLRKRLVLVAAEGGGAAGLIKAVDRRLAHWRLREAMSIGKRPAPTLANWTA